MPRYYQRTSKSSDKQQHTNTQRHCLEGKTMPRIVEQEESFEFFKGSERECGGRRVRNRAQGNANNDDKSS